MRNPFEGFWEDWSIGHYRARNGNRSIWIANGFFFFADDDGGESTLLGFNIIERLLLWWELKAEVKRRVIKELEK